MKSGLRVIIYESSSFGGCYKYALELFSSYGAHPEVAELHMLLPLNSTLSEPGIKKVLLNDRKAGKLNFLIRHFLNPLKLFFLLRKEAPSFVLLNDFEQISAPIWSPLYRLLLGKHVFGIFLHDADRDAYPPSPGISAFCMKQALKAMDLVLYHAPLPDRSYYRDSVHARFLEVEHGSYPLPETDPDFTTELKAFSAGYKWVFSMPGNIRKEKNYPLIFEALSTIPDACLIISGSTSSSSVDLEKLKMEAVRFNVESRVLWVLRYLTDEELSAVIKLSDLIILYYSSSFHSQSGILHQLIPERKPVLVSDLPSALTETVRKFGIGIVCKADDPIELNRGIREFMQKKPDPDWDAVNRSLDWNKQVEKVIESIKELGTLNFSK